MGSCCSAEESSQRKSENYWKDYVDFWEKVGNSKRKGHGDLKVFLETNTNILIGERIPNKAFWKKIKGKDAIVDASKFLTNICGTFADMTLETKDNIVDIPQEDELIGNYEVIESGETIEYDTVFRIILDNVYNGHQLILHILDSLVEKVKSNDCLECVDSTSESKVKINIYKMFKFSSDALSSDSKTHSTKAVLNKQTKSLVRDLIDIQRERPGDDNIKKIFQHPVIELLILKKWEHYKMPYIRDVRRFAFVVLLFTFFVRLRILGEAKSKCNPASEWEKRDPTTDFIDSLLNCGDWVGSNISEEALTRCDSRIPAYIANNSADCSDLVLNANIYWLVNSAHWAYDILPKNSDPIYDWLLIFKYRKDHFYISVSVMACIVLSQVVLFLWALFQRFAWYGRKYDEQKSNSYCTALLAWLATSKSWAASCLRKNPRNIFKSNSSQDMESQEMESEQVPNSSSEIKSEPSASRNCVDHNRHNRKRMNMIIMFKFVNLFYLLLGNIVCFIPWKSGPRISLTVTICVVLGYLLITEVLQFTILVLRPAMQICTKGIYGSIKSLVGNRYFRDPDNYLEFICFISIPLALFNKTWPQTEKEAGTAAFCRGLIAMGVFAAWMELFIKMGNVSHSVVGNFIKMFYNIIKSNLLAYMQACLLLMTAFSLAFWIILEGHIKKTGVNFSSGFWVNLVLTVTMSVGEFNTTSFYDEINENKIIKVFAMLFLIGLVIFSTITMVNLLMSAIIYDYADMKKEVEIENLYFIAEYIIEEGEYAYCYRYIKEKYIKTRCIYKVFHEDDHTDKNKRVLEFCPRLVCINCELDPVPIPRPFSKNNPAMEAKEREPLLRRLLEIRKGKSKLCEYHGGKTSEEKVSALLELLELKKDASKLGGEISKETISEQNPNYFDHNTSQGI